jgi:hypothetical protein
MADPGGASCPHCRGDLDHAHILSGRQFCPLCRHDFEATKFDPPRRLTPTRALSEAGPEGATACGNHPGNAASANCERCGIFMCELCRIDSDSMVLCPACFERLGAEGALPSGRTRFKDYGRMGFTWVLAGILIWFAALPLGLGAVYAGIRGLRQKSRIGEGSAARCWTVIVLGTVEAVGSALLISYMFLRNGVR